MGKLLDAGRAVTNRITESQHIAISRALFAALITVQAHRALTADEWERGARAAVDAGGLFAGWLLKERARQRQGGGA